jgi:hypothetical protein
VPAVQGGRVPGSWGAAGARLFGLKAARRLRPARDVNSSEAAEGFPQHLRRQVQLMPGFTSAAAASAAAASAAAARRAVSASAVAAACCSAILLAFRSRFGRLGVDGGLLHRRRFCGFDSQRSTLFLLGRGEGGGLLRLLVAGRLLLPLLSLISARCSSSWATSCEAQF